MSGRSTSIDPAIPKIPDELWRASGRPLTSWLVRGWIALLLIGTGWILASFVAPVGVYGWAVAGLGVVAFFAIPPIIDAIVLQRFATRVDAVERARAHKLLDELRANNTIKMLAPHGWTRIQEAKLHLAVDEHRAAAKAFAEAERVSTHSGDKAELLSAQAHAHALAGDRKEARELLGRLAKLERLSDLDHFNFGIVLLSEPGHNKEALAHLEQASETFGEHPRLLAALVLARQRCDQIEQATALLEKAEAAVEASGDVLAQDLLKRGKKALRPLLKTKQKRERKAAPADEPAKAGTSKSDKPKGKKGRKQARRDARKQARATERRGETGATAEAAQAVSEAVEESSAESDESSSENDESSAESDESSSENDESSSENAETPDETDEASSDSEETSAEDEETSDEADETSSGTDETSSGTDETSSGTDETSSGTDETEAPVEAPRAAEPILAPTPIETPSEPIAVIEAPAIETPPVAERPTTKPARKDDDEGIDLASLALDALSSGVRPKIEDSERSGLRPLDAAASSSTFRSALFASEPEPKQPDKPSLFGLPKFGDLPKFTPPPMPPRGSILPPRPTEPEPKPATPKPPEPAVAPKPVAAAPTPAIAPKPTAAPKPAVPPLAAPKLTVPSVPSVPSIPNTSAPKPSTPPALDDGWGDLGDLAPPPTTPDPNSDGS